MASPRLISTKYPRRDRGVAATRLQKTTQRKYGFQVALGRAEVERGPVVVVADVDVRAGLHEVS